MENFFEINNLRKAHVEHSFYDNWLQFDVVTLSISDDIKRCIQVIFQADHEGAYGISSENNDYLAKKLNCLQIGDLKFEVRYALIHPKSLKPEHSEEKNYLLPNIESTIILELAQTTASKIFITFSDRFTL